MARIPGRVTQDEHSSCKGSSSEDSEANLQVDEVAFPIGEMGVDEGDRDHWIMFTIECVEDNHDDFDDDEVVDPGDTDELAPFIGCVRNKTKHQACTTPQTTGTPSRGRGIHGLKISLLGSLLVSASLNGRSTGMSTLFPLGLRSQSAHQFTDRTVAGFRISPRQPDQHLIQNKPYPSVSTEIASVASIAFPVGDWSSDGFDRPDSLALHPLELDLRPRLGLAITNPLRSLITRIVNDMFVANADLLVPTIAVATINRLISPVDPAIPMIDPQRSSWIYPTDTLTDTLKISQPEEVPEGAPFRYPTTKFGEIDRSIPILQTTVWDGAGGQRIFEIGDQLTQPQQYVIYNFDLVGTGANPSVEVRKALDALKFIGDNFTADKLELNQRGPDLVITFTGNELVKVILKDRQREDFDNLGLKPIEGIDPSFGVGNILFNTDRVILDTIDVFDAVLLQSNAVISPFNSNTTTFFNEQNNLVQGFNHSNDIIHGLGGDDIIFGLGGDDRLSGDAGNDILFGNAGNNLLTGGSGADIFALSGDGFSRVTDFNVCESDRIGLTDGLTVDGLSVETSVTANGTTTLISNRFTHKRLMELPGITSTMLTRDLFVPISSQISDYCR